MSVHIHFDQPESTCYTNLDFISGIVSLNLPNDAAISAITVKLEGECRTRLAGPRYGEHDRPDKKRTELELHKLLYKVVTVFPTPAVLEKCNTAAFTLVAGQYRYPFKFKFPFNNDCTKSPSPLKDLKMGQLNVQFAPVLERHVKRTLPPSLTGFPGEAEIKYFVKATVVRPKFFQENIRSILDIKFLPIEPPRPPDRNEETFARRRRQFQRAPPSLHRKGFFSKAAPTTNAAEEPPAFQVDARLPNPAIITCNEPLPLRILVEKINDSAATAFLSMLQIELIGYTKVRAHDLERTESMSWVVLSQANMNMPLGDSAEKGRREWKVPSRLWENLPLPNTVAPSFDTCNISRRYELEVRVGLAHGGADGGRPELIVLPLRLPVNVFSGIAPPPKLLQAMANSSPARPAASPLFTAPLDKPTAAPEYMADTPATPADEINAYPAQVGSSHIQPDIPDEAPPSYEDAIADDIAPVDGPRREYNVAPRSEESRHAFNTDSKGDGLGRRASERLFASHGPRASSGTTTSPGAMGAAEDGSRTSPTADGAGRSA